MKQFSLEEYLENPSKKIVTREGKDARIICTDVKSEKYQVVALVTKKGGQEILATFDTSGKYRSGYNSHLDLFFAPEKHEGWTLFVVNWKSIGADMLDSIIYTTREEAQRMRETNPGRYGAIVKLEWEE